jgi:hypothetical protein
MGRNQRIGLIVGLSAGGFALLMGAFAVVITMIVSIAA